MITNNTRIKNNSNGMLLAVYEITKTGYGVKVLGQPISLKTSDFLTIREFNMMVEREVYTILN